MYDSHLTIGRPFGILQKFIGQSQCKGRPGENYRNPCCRHASNRVKAHDSSLKDLSHSERRIRCQSDIPTQKLRQRAQLGVLAYSLKATSSRPPAIIAGNAATICHHGAAGSAEATGRDD